MNEIKATTKSLENEPLKTEQFLEEKAVEQPANTTQFDLQATTTSDPNDPTKTITVLSKPKGKVKVKVIGPFNGETEVDSGTVLKDALKNLNTENETYGKYKYRDESDTPVGITHVVEGNMTLTSISKA